MTYKEIVNEIFAIMDERIDEYILEDQVENASILIQVYHDILKKVTEEEE